MLNMYFKTLTIVVLFFCSLLPAVQVRSSQIESDFLLTGDSTMTWAGAAPTQSSLAFQFKVGAVIPAPTVFGLAGAGLIGLGGVRFARRRRA